MVRIKVTAGALVLACAATPAHALLACGGLFSSAVSVSASALDFGNYTPSTDDFASAGISIKCGALGIDILPGFTISLTAMNGSDPAARYLNRSGAHLSYNIYTTSGYSRVWGDGSNGSVTQSYSALLTLGNVNFTAWGKLPKGQYLATGAYTDTITVLVSY